MLTHMGGNVYAFAFAVPGFTLLCRFDEVFIFTLIDAEGEDILS